MSIIKRLLANVFERMSSSDCLLANVFSERLIPGQGRRALAATGQPRAVPAQLPDPWGTPMSMGGSDYCSVLHRTGLVSSTFGFMKSPDFSACALTSSHSAPCMFMVLVGT